MCWMCNAGLVYDLSGKTKPCPNGCGIPEPPDPIFPDGKRPWWAGRKCRKCKGKLFEVKEQKWGGFLVCQSCGHEQEFVTADMSIADSPITGQKPGEWEEL